MNFSTLSMSIVKMNRRRQSLWFPRLEIKNPRAKHVGIFLLSFFNFCYLCRANFEFRNFRNWVQGRVGQKICRRLPKMKRDENHSLLRAIGDADVYLNRAPPGGNRYQFPIFNPQLLGVFRTNLYIIFGSKFVQGFDPSRFIA